MQNSLRSFSNIFFFRLNMKQKGFGLDIGATHTKMVWLEQSKEGFLLKGAAIGSTPLKGMLSESPLDQEEMAKSLVKLANENKIMPKAANTALPENQVYTKIIEMPVLSDNELASAIYWEAEQYIPVPLQTVTIDWKILKRPQTPSTDSKMQVLLVGAPSVLIDKYQKVIEMSGITLNAIETEILSTIRALVVGNQFPNTLIIHIGALTTSLAIIKDGLVVFTYSVATGGAGINRAIAADFGLSFQQAEEYKRTYGVNQKLLGGKIGQSTTPILMAIVTEVKKALLFYNQKYKDETPIQQILLSGGTAKLPSIDVFFAQNCGIETVTANPWKVLASQQVPREILDNAPDYTIAVGLAMKDYE